MFPHTAKGLKTVDLFSRTLTTKSLMKKDIITNNTSFNNVKSDTLAKSKVVTITSDDEMKQAMYYNIVGVKVYNDTTQQILEQIYDENANNSDSVQTALDQYAAALERSNETTSDTVLDYKPYSGHWSCSKAIWSNRATGQVMEKSIDRIDFYFSDNENTINMESLGETLERHYKETILPDGKISIEINDDFNFIFFHESGGLIGSIYNQDGSSDMLELEFIQEDMNVLVNNANQAEYFISSSNIQYLNLEDLLDFSVEELRLARNEIYARHGRIFTSEDLHDYFNSKDWYVPSIDADEFDKISTELFNDFEEYNVNFIKDYEDSLK